jgi:uncharacterized protein
MVATTQQKEQIMRDLAVCLAREKEVCKVVVFGSFLTSMTPNDLDVAIFQDSDEPCLPLAMKYRRLLRQIADQIPLDVIPVRPTADGSQFLAEIQKGEVVYEEKRKFKDTHWLFFESEPFAANDGGRRLPRHIRTDVFDKNLPIRPVQTSKDDV